MLGENGEKERNREKEERKVKRHTHPTFSC